jgi:hypothetical protein
MMALVYSDFYGVRFESATNHTGAIAAGGGTRYLAGSIACFTDPNPNHVGGFTIAITTWIAYHACSFTSAAFVDWHYKFSTC